MRWHQWRRARICEPRPAGADPMAWTPARYPVPAASVLDCRFQGGGYHIPAVKEMAGEPVPLADKLPTGVAGRCGRPAHAEMTRAAADEGRPTHPAQRTRFRDSSSSARRRLPGQSSSRFGPSRLGGQGRATSLRCPRRGACGHGVRRSSHARGLAVRGRRASPQWPVAGALAHRGCAAARTRAARYARRNAH
jgi:hypothetical protein